MNIILSKHLSASSLRDHSEEPASPHKLSTSRQTAFLSSSIPQPRHFIKQCVQRRWSLNDDPQWIHMRNPENAATRLPSQIVHYFRICEKEKKLVALRQFLKAEFLAHRLERAIVFVNSDRPLFLLEKVAAALKKDLADLAALTGRPLANAAKIAAADDGGGGGVGGDDEDHDHDVDDDDDDDDEGRGGGEVEEVSKGTVEDDSIVAVLTEELGLNGRAAAMKAYRSGSARILIATDLASRGSVVC